MRICTNCGHALEDGEEICSVCSSDLITETGTEAEETAPEAAHENAKLASARTPTQPPNSMSRRANAPKPAAIHPVRQ